LREVESAECFEKQKHAEHEAEVANAIDDEGFFAGVGGGLFEELETDEQIAGEPDAFPPDEEENVVCGEDQDEHEEHEEVEVGEEAVVAAFMRHVAGGVDVD
jgi:cobalamin biosynthesis protein CobT